MPNPTGSTVSIQIDKGDGNPAGSFDNIPWYPGLTILQAMIIAQAMYPSAFNFKINFHSEYGAFVESIDDTAENAGKYWMLALDGKEEGFGPSEAIIVESPTGAKSTVLWTLKVPSAPVKSVHTAARIARRRVADMR
jgi:hypothetical protein